MLESSAIRGNKYFWHCSLFVHQSVLDWFNTWLSHYLQHWEGRLKTCGFSWLWAFSSPDQLKPDKGLGKCLQSTAGNWSSLHEFLQEGDSPSKAAGSFCTWLLKRGQRSWLQMVVVCWGCHSVGRFLSEFSSHCSATEECSWLVNPCSLLFFFSGPCVWSQR